jgi:hypothetical protein
MSNHDECAHKWVFQGVVHSLGRQVPGSGALQRVYEDRFYCEKCLAQIETNERILGNSYYPPEPGSLPK